jgi:hypothetical protein
MLFFSCYVLLFLPSSVSSYWSMKWCLALWCWNIWSILLSKSSHAIYPSKNCATTNASWLKRWDPFCPSAYYICYRSQICQPSACFAYWLDSFPHSENWDSLTNCMRIISHCHTCFMAFWIPFYEETYQWNARKLPFTQAPCQMLFMDVGGCWL